MKTKKSTGPAPDFQSGQVWRMGEDRLQIELVGKWLVHYRQYTALNKKLPTRFAALSDLQKLLSAHKAVLVQDKEFKGKVLRARTVRRGRNRRPTRRTRAGARRCIRR